MTKVLLLAAFCGLCFGAIFFDECYNDCCKSGLKTKPRTPLNLKDKKLLNSVYNELSNEDYSK